jgi:hypothetical protein
MEHISSVFEKDNISFAMKETINNGNEKIRQRKKNKLVMVTASDKPQIAAPATAACNLNYMGIESASVMRHNVGATDVVIATSHVAFADTHIDTTVDKQPQRCQGEKKKGGRCSRKAKKGNFCETHSTEKKEIERRLEGGVYVYRCKEQLYDIEEILRLGNAV